MDPNSVIFGAFADSKRVLCHHEQIRAVKTKTSSIARCFWSYFGAGNEVRTRDLNLGKVALYQLSYSRKNGVP